MTTYHLDDTLKSLKGPTKEQIIVNNQWAAVALDNFHSGSSSLMNFQIDGMTMQAVLKWNSSFSKVAMKEENYWAFYGGESLAMFVMSVICGFKYAEQTEIGTGVDYRFI